MSILGVGIGESDKANQAILDVPGGGGRQGLRDYEQQSIGIGEQKAARAPITADYSGNVPANAAQQQAMYGAVNGAGNTANMNQALAMAYGTAAGTGPSAALQQQKQGIDQAIQAQAAMANSARGGAMAQNVAQRDASNAGAQMQQAGVQNAMVERAREQLAGQQLYGNLSNQAYMNQVQANALAAQTAAQARGQGSQEAQFGANLALQNQQAADQQQLAYRNMANSLIMGQGNLDTSHESNYNNATTADTALGVNTAMQLGGGLFNAAGGAMASDIRAKEEVKPAGTLDEHMAQYGALAAQHQAMQPDAYGLRAQAEQDHVAQLLAKQQQDQDLANVEGKFQEQRRSYLKKPEDVGTPISRFFKGFGEGLHSDENDKQDINPSDSSAYSMKGGGLDVKGTIGKVNVGVSDMFKHGGIQGGITSSKDSKKDKKPAELPIEFRPSEEPGKAHVWNKQAQTEEDIKAFMAGAQAAQQAAPTMPAMDPGTVAALQANRSRVIAQQDAAREGMPALQESAFRQKAPVQSQGYLNSGVVTGPMLQAQQAGEQAAAAAQGRAEQAAKYISDENTKKEMKTAGKEWTPTGHRIDEIRDEVNEELATKSREKVLSKEPKWFDNIRIAADKGQAAVDKLKTKIPGGQHIKEPWQYFSDEDVKTNKKEAEADAFLDTLKPFSYKYKNPNDEPSSEPNGGRYLGVMAQNVEKGPTGDTIVHEDPSGKKFLEMGSMLSALAAGTGRLHERLAALESKKGK